MAIEEVFADDALSSTTPGSSGAREIGLENIAGLSLDGLTPTEVYTALLHAAALLGQKLDRVQDEGVDLPRQPKINFEGAGVSAQNNPTDGSTDVTIAGLSDYPHVERVTIAGVDVGQGRILDVSGDLVTLELDAENGVYRLEANLPNTIPTPEEPATTTNPGVVKMSAAPEDPGNPVAVGINDPSVTDARPPTAHNHDDRYALINHGHDLSSLPHEHTVAQLPIADDGEENANKVPRANDSRLENRRDPNDLSVTPRTAGEFVSLPIICESTARPELPKKGQIIIQTDDNAMMKNHGDPAVPNWQPVTAVASSVTLQNEGIALAQRTTWDLRGEGIHAYDDASVPGSEKTVMEVPGLKVQRNGVNVGTHATLNFVGVTAADDPDNGRVNVTPTATSMSTFWHGLGGYCADGSNVTVEPGAAWVPSLGRILELTGALAFSLTPFAADTWVYVYLYENAGAAALDPSTTAPVSYRGNAHQKTGDATRRYLFAVKTKGTAGQGWRFRHDGRFCRYIETHTEVPFRVVSNAANTTFATRSAAGVVPLTSTRFLGSVFHNASGVQLALPEDTTRLLWSTGSFTQQPPVFVETNPAREFAQRNGATGGNTAIDVLGYYEQR